MELSNANFETIRMICVARARKRLQSEIRRTTNIRNLFELLACNRFYFNWMNVEYLKTMAIAAGSKKLQDMIRDYTDVVLSKTLGEVWNSMPSFQIRGKYFNKVKAKFRVRNPDDITIQDLKKYESKLAGEIALDIMQIKSGSITITWCVAAEEAYCAYQLALKIPQGSREDTFLQIGEWVVFHPQSVLREIRKAHGQLSE